MNHSPATVASLKLSDTQAGELWNWLLSRQGLGDSGKFDSVTDIAHVSLGLHAARLPSPFSTVLARGASPAVAMTLLQPERGESVTTVRCMRKTLHTLPLPLAAVAHAATLHFRERDALRAITNAGVSMRSIDRTIGDITRVLADGPLFHRNIEERLTTSRRPTGTVRLALKLAWERGTLTYVNRAAGWNREHRTFALTEALYPGLDMAMDRGKATGELVREYFDRYGPATMRDVMWWSALSRAAVATAMAESVREWVEVRTSWCDSPMYMYRDRLSQFDEAGASARTTGVNFLAHEDVALKAYFESRRRYLGTLPARRAFNQIGEVLPTLLFDGQVVGTWAWDNVDRRVTTSIVRGYGSPTLSRQVAKRRDVLTEVLRAGWVHTAGPSGASSGIKPDEAQLTQV
jgi:hypothetical protein